MSLNSAGGAPKASKRASRRASMLFVAVSPIPKASNRHRCQKSRGDIFLEVICCKLYYDSRHLQIASWQNEPNCKKNNRDSVLAINEWRASQSPVPNLTEAIRRAIRRLLAIALKIKPPEK